jgi:TIR domain-containing protein
MAKEIMMRDSIFFSYCREDYRWLNELKAVLASIENEVRLNLWDDSRISPAAEWQREIDEALSTAAAAVLLLSPDFFASEFISQRELPPLLEAAHRGELKLFSVIVSPCAHEQITGVFQAVNDPSRPISTLTDAERRLVWERVLEQVTAAGATIADEARIGAEMIRLNNDLAARPEIKAINDKMNAAKADSNLEGIYLENVVCFLEGQRCQLLATALMEEMQRPGLAPARSTAIVRALEYVHEVEEQALMRAKELTQIFADETMQMLRAAKESSDKA